jgi:hypothetical protein
VEDNMRALPHRRQSRFQLSFIPSNLMTRLVFCSHKFTTTWKSEVHACWHNYVVLKKGEQLASLWLEDNSESVLQSARQQWVGAVHIEVSGTAPYNMSAVLADMVS